jgi:phosphate acetyltransferase
VDKVIRAYELLKAKNPDFIFDGELQGTRLLFLRLRRRNARQSGCGQGKRAYIPDLNCGNIAYKLVQRLPALKP